MIKIPFFLSSLFFRIHPPPAAGRQKQKIHGPVDGSLYATILKGPKCPSVILSPPSDFRESSLGGPYSKSRFSGSTQSLQVFPSSHYSHDQQRLYLSPTPSSTTTTLRHHRSRDDYSPSLASTVADSVQFQRAFSTPPQEQQHQQRVVDERYQAINQSPINRQHLQRSTPQQFVHEIRIVEECNRRGGGGEGVGKSTNAKLGSNARDSLTLSMDSGISSSVQRQQQQQLVHNSK